MGTLFPHDSLELQIYRFSGKLRYTIKVQSKERAVAVTDFMPLDFFSDLRLDREFFSQLTRKRLTLRLAWLDFTAGKLPLARVPSTFSLADQYSTVSLDHRSHNVHAIIEARMHSERLLDHFKNPRNVGELAAPAIRVDVSNPACGDMMRLFARFEDDRVVEARYQVRGCTASIAAGSALTEWMIGKSRGELKTLTVAVIEEAVGGLEPASKHAAVLSVDAVKIMEARIP